MGSGDAAPGDVANGLARILGSLALVTRWLKTFSQSWWSKPYDDSSHCDRDAIAHILCVGELGRRGYQHVDVQQRAGRYVLPEGYLGRGFGMHPHVNRNMFAVGGGIDGHERRDWRVHLDSDGRALVQHRSLHI